LDQASLPSTIPASYDQYYHRVLQANLKYGVPLGAFLYIGFFGWDLLFVQSPHDGVKVLAWRTIFAITLMVFWFVMPRIRSTRVLSFCIAILYLMALLIIMAILSVLPEGFKLGGAGLLLCTIFSGGVFGMRPLPAAICGLVALAVLIPAASGSGLSAREVASQAIFFGSGVLASIVFLFLLERERRKRYELELALQGEKEQSEALLKEILPRYVIQRIREGADVIAESISEVNIIFIDIVGFTTISRRLAPNHLIEILGEVFGALDAQCEPHGVTKIKTIGDAYMAATGAPEPSSLSALAAVEFCLSAIDAVDAIAQRTGIPLRIRAGIATGAAISGVLSLKRPAYDLWGETVNLASRMEQTAEPGTIHIAETTFWRVKDRFNCVPRDLVDVKGFGPVQSFLIQHPSGDQTIRITGPSAAQV